MPYYGYVCKFRYIHTTYRSSLRPETFVRILRPQAPIFGLIQVVAFNVDSGHSFTPGGNSSVEILVV